MVLCEAVAYCGECVVLCETVPYCVQWVVLGFCTILFTVCGFV